MFIPRERSALGDQEEDGGGGGGGGCGWSGGSGGQDACVSVVLHAMSLSPIVCSHHSWPGLYYGLYTIQCYDSILHYAEL